MPVRVTLLDGRGAISNVEWKINGKAMEPVLMHFWQVGDTGPSHRVDAELPQVKAGDRLDFAFSMLSGETRFISLVLTNSDTGQVLLFAQPDGAIQQATRFPPDDHPFRLQMASESKTQGGTTNR